jgi:transposase
LLDKRGNDSDNIIIDSTGLPNSIHFPLTAISNHNGDINNEVRLIYMVQQKTGLPIYFRYCPGNVIDASTLTRCVAELKEQGVNMKFAILDAGYYTEANIALLFVNKISFVTRLKENLTVYKDLVREHAQTLESEENLVEYNGRYVYLKCVPCNLCGNNAYAYIGLDVERKNSEAHNTIKKAKSKNMTPAQVHEAIHRQGLFVLISSRRIATKKLLPLYYTRQQVEQIFDIGKNYADMLPLRIQTEETFRGHLLLTFLATIVIKKIQDELKKSTYTPISLFLNLRNQKCKIYSNKVITQEAFKKANDCYKHFNIECPIEINAKHPCG